jgi:hypothetical protein
MEGGSFFEDPEDFERRALGMGISPYGGSVGQPGVSSPTGDFETWLRGSLGVVRLSLWELCEGNLEGWLPLLGTLKICRKALETGISLHRGPVLGNLEEGSSTRDLKVWTKGAQWMKCLSLSLKRLCGGPHHWGPWRIC